MVECASIVLNRQFNAYFPSLERSLMKYLLLVSIMLPSLSWSQANVAGLGHYVVGITTSASLNLVDFKEEDPSYVKGTIALPCNHIRTFTSARTEVAGTPITNVVLVFYDNTLFSIICDYSDTLKERFVKQYGLGVKKPKSHFQLCTTEKDKPLLVWSEAWPGKDVLAFVTYIEGYTADCTWKAGALLRVFNQKIAALSSECDLQLIPSYLEMYDREGK
ncbi:MAG: hypothetical protein JWP57_3140 [Spirosoma sp.]|nr:hypothetical protein [Spirosoma sp.]